MVTAEKGKVEFDLQPIERAYGTTYSYGDGGYEGPKVMITYSRFAEGFFLVGINKMIGQINFIFSCKRFGYKY